MIIWLASYPRSGNTFLRTVLHSAFGVDTYSVYGDKNDIAANPATAEQVGHKDLPEGFSYEEARAGDVPWFIKTHEPYERSYDQDRVIYVVRDGRDAVVSYYHYLRDFSPRKLSYMEIMAGLSFAGTWGDHVLGWEKLDPARKLLVRFEEATHDPADTIARLEGFLDMPARHREIPDFERLHNTDPKFFRSGRSRSFELELSEDERTFFWVTNGITMRRLGYTDDDSAQADANRLVQALAKSFRLDLTAYTDPLSARLCTLDRRGEDFNRQLTRLQEELTQELSSMREELGSTKRDAEEAQRRADRLAEQLNGVRASAAYRIGRFLTGPVRILKRLFS